MHNTPHNRPFFLPVLTASAMQEADRKTIDSFGIPAFTLMESAGRAAMHILEQHIGEVGGKTVLCLCGKGNNGGDGFVISRLLAERGAIVHVYAMAEPGQMATDADRNYAFLQQIERRDEKTQLSLHLFEHVNQLENHKKIHAIVDALLGTGIKNELRSPYSDIVNWINHRASFTLSVDIPTGLHADTGSPLGVAVEADATVSMGAYKTGHFLGQGVKYTGRVDVAEIGIPGFIIDQEVKSEGCAFIATQELIKSWLPDRPHDAHKYSVGMALVVAGSRGLTGAATLSCRSAEQTGAGAVVCATPIDVQPILAGKMTEVMTMGLPTSQKGIQVHEAIDLLKPKIEKASALLIGCGMGQLEDTQVFIRTLLQQVNKPVVLDADGLNAMQGHTGQISELSKGNWILTPHMGEFRRLAGKNLNLDERVESVKKYAEEWNCVLILKGAPSLVADPRGNVYINPTGNSALATAGTGDVLAGYCTGLLAQGLSPLQAALCALHIGGAAAEYYATVQHPSTMLASDLIEATRTVLFNDYSA